MYKKARCTCKIVVLLIRPVAFVVFPLPSPSSDLKVPTTSFRENVEVAETRYQMLEVLSFCDRERV